MKIFLSIFNLNDLSIFNLISIFLYHLIIGLSSNTKGYIMIKYFGVYIGVYEEEWIAYGETKTEILNKIIELCTDNIGLIKEDITYYKVRL